MNRQSAPVRRLAGLRPSVGGYRDDAATMRDPLAPDRRRRFPSSAVASAGSDPAAPAGTVEEQRVEGLRRTRARAGRPSSCRRATPRSAAGRSRRSSAPRSPPRSAPRARRGHRVREPTPGATVPRTTIAPTRALGSRHGPSARSSSGILRLISFSMSAEQRCVLVRHQRQRQPVAPARPVRPMRWT